MKLIENMARALQERGAQIDKIIMGVLYVGASYMIVKTIINLLI